MKKVLITGANGRIGTLLREQLGEHYQFSGITHRPVDFPSLVADLADLDAIQPAFERVDAVVHMAANAHVGAPWDEIVRDNIVGTHNVYEAARRAGVGSVIFASSNHAVAGWEIAWGPSVYDLDDPRTLDASVEPRPDSYYGFSKAAGEVLGRQYVDLHGLRVLCLRIGWVIGPPDDPRQVDVSGEVAPALTPEHTRRRLRAIWLSHRDCVHLVDCCLQADHVDFGIYYGISNNPRQIYDLTNARREVGYAPRDSAPSELGEP